MPSFSRFTPFLKGNLAFRQPVFQSSVRTKNGLSWAASYAVDGLVYEDVNLCAGTNSELYAWWGVDLGSVVTVKDVTVVAHHCKFLCNAQLFIHVLTPSQND